jgi:SAM-dependent methyltransferase
MNGMNEMTNAKIRIFGREDDVQASKLRAKLDDFYAKTREYDAFQESNYKPEFWQPIKVSIQECLEAKDSCHILEFGAGCTGFGDYLQELKHRVIFHVQDVTASNREYLLTQADQVHICDVYSIQEKYDIIFSTFVWEHITNPKVVLDHLLNLLNPSGSIFLASPRYDFPFYLSPSSKHLPIIERFRIAIWLQWRRLYVLLTGRPDFLIHFDPAVFHRPWFSDADAIHWVSLGDLKYHLPKDLDLERLHIPTTGFRSKIWESFLLLFVRIRKPLN